MKFYLEIFKTRNSLGDLGFIMKKNMGLDLSHGVKLWCGCVQKRAQ
jgi:hypothetical protein